MQEQTCALRALSLEDQDDGCVAIPCHCDVEREVERRRGYVVPESVGQRQIRRPRRR